MKVLLVDDDVFLRDMYATKFIECGHTVDVAGDAKEALAKIEDGGYDVVLLDVIMPATNGLELLKEIVEKDMKKGAKFIILSNQSDSSDQTAAKEAGADGYVIKAEAIPTDVVKQVEAVCKA